MEFILGVAIATVSYIFGIMALIKPEKVVSYFSDEEIDSKKIILSRVVGVILLISGTISLVLNFIIW